MDVLLTPPLRVVGGRLGDDRMCTTRGRYVARSYKVADASRWCSKGDDGGNEILDFQE